MPSAGEATSHVTGSGDRASAHTGHRGSLSVHRTQCAVCTTHASEKCYLPLHMQSATWFAELSVQWATQSQWLTLVTWRSMHISTCSYWGMEVQQSMALGEKLRQWYTHTHCQMNGIGIHTQEPTTTVCSMYIKTYLQLKGFAKCRQNGGQLIQHRIAQLCTQSLLSWEDTYVVQRLCACMYHTHFTSTMYSTHHVCSVHACDRHM